MNHIERMNKFRKNLLKGILWGFGIWATMQVIWTGVAFNGIISQASHVFRIISYIIQYAVYASILITIFFSLKYWRYKWSLRNDPQIRSALDDERLRLSWYKAYRFAFFTLVATYIILLLNDYIPAIIFHKRFVCIPQETQTQLTPIVAVLSCVGAFLHYSREE